MPTLGFDCAAVIAHIEQLLGSSPRPGDRDKGIAECRQRIARNPDDPLTHCMVGTTTVEEMLSCIQLEKSPLAGKLVKDCVEMNDHVFGLFKAEGFALPPEKRQEAIDGCIATFAEQPEHLSLQCLLHAASVDAVIACGKDKPRRKVHKRPQAEINLERIAKLAHAAHDRSGAFPKGAAPLLPEVSCCKNASGKCEPTPTWKTDPVWSALGFAMDEPGLFQYSYASDGTTFHAEAVGDLDCDGIFITWKLDGDTNGERVTPPPPNTD